MNQVLTCQQFGHEGEPIIGLCLSKECRKQGQYCSECLVSYHSSHQNKCKSTNKLKKMINDFQTEINNWLSNIQAQYQLIHNIYQKTRELLANENNSLIELENYLQIENYYQIIERAYIFKKADAILETKQNIQQKSFLGIINLQRRNDSPNDEERKIKQALQYSITEGIKGQQFIDSRKYNEALSCLNGAIEINYKNSSTLRQQCFYFCNSRVDVINCQELSRIFKLEKYQEAIKRLNEFKMSDEHNATANYNKGIMSCISFDCLGQTIVNLKRYEEALICFDQTLQLDQKYKKAYFKKGEALILKVPDTLIIESLKRYGEAIKCYDQAIQLDLNYKEAYSNKGEQDENLFQETYQFQFLMIHNILVILL